MNQYLEALEAAGAGEDVIEAYREVRRVFSGNQSGSIAGWAIQRYCNEDESVRDDFIELGESVGIFEVKPVLYFEDDVWGDGNLDWERMTIKPDEVDDYRVSENQVIHPHKGEPVDGRITFEPFLTRDWLDYQSNQELPEPARDAIISALEVLAGVSSVATTPPEVQRTLRGMVSTGENLLGKYLRES